MRNCVCLVAREPFLFFFLFMGTGWTWIFVSLGYIQQQHNHKNYRHAYEIQISPSRKSPLEEHAHKKKKINKKRRNKIYGFWRRNCCCRFYIVKSWAAIESEKRGNGEVIESVVGQWTTTAKDLTSLSFPSVSGMASLRREVLFFSCIQIYIRFSISLCIYLSTNCVKP